MEKSIGPSMHPCRTPIKVGSHDLWDQSSRGTVCFLPRGVLVCQHYLLHYVVGTERGFQLGMK